MIGNDWDKHLYHVFNSSIFNDIYSKVLHEYNEKIIYPPLNDLFNAFKLTNYESVKVVILGQDPYHGDNEAHGLSFSVKEGKLPPSLRNIFKELKDDLNIVSDTSDLSTWARNGVLLLNSVLTVEKDKPASHKKLNWQYFTDEVIKILNEKKTPIVFILWGAFARSKKNFITNDIHLVLESVHPSPFSARNGFFGSKPFSKTNDFFIKNKMQGISWDL